MTPLSGTIAGYDPGGNGGHGFALAAFDAGACTHLVTETLPDAEAVINRLNTLDGLVAIGIDTLAAWATGASGWRPADHWLREAYPSLRPSIVSPNGLYGSMGLNGMAVLASVRHVHRAVHVTETHPKVLYWALSRAKYDYHAHAAGMDAQLSAWLNHPVNTANDHEWDAAVSVLAAFKGVTGQWTHDLFAENRAGSGRLVFPSGPTHYWWPE